MIQQPLFVGERIARWSQPEIDPPDVLCWTASGKVIGVELGSWLDEIQITERKQQERIENEILATIGEQPENFTQHFRFIWLHPRSTVHMREIRADEFRRELFALISEEDRGWTARARSRMIVRIPSSFPALAHALQSVQFFERRESDMRVSGVPWIRFRNWGGAYHPRSMVEALLRRLKEKREKYRFDGKLASLAEFVLIVHYDQALLYNTPTDAPGFGFKDAIAEGRAFVSTDAGAFRRIFVMIAIEPGGRTVQIYP